MSGSGQPFRRTSGHDSPGAGRDGVPRTPILDRARYRPAVAGKPYRRSGTTLCPSGGWTMLSTSPASRFNASAFSSSVGVAVIDALDTGYGVTEHAFGNVGTHPGPAHQGDRAVRRRSCMHPMRHVTEFFVQRFLALAENELKVGGSGRFGIGSTPTAQTAGKHIGIARQAAVRHSDSQ